MTRREELEHGTVLHENSLRARLGEAGNQIHNIACEMHGNEDLQDDLVSLACRAWQLSQRLPSDALIAQEGDA